MNKIIFCCFLLLAGCSRPTEPARTPQAKSVSQEQLADSFGALNYQELTNAIAHATDKDDVLNQLAVSEYARETENLASFSIAELNRRIDCVHRGTSRSGYTEEQLLTAIHIKQQRIAEKAVNK